MSLEEDLKARALALISQQMANWVVEIQRQIGEHQASLVRTLDDLQENVARYDEKINEDDIALAMAEVVASQPPPEPPAPKGPGFDQLRAAIVEIERGTSLAEVLTFLVNQASRHVDRAAMFIVKGTNAIGWYARGVTPPDAIKQLNIPLSADTVFRNVQNRTTYRGAISASPGTQQVMARLGGQPAGLLAVPLILRDKLAAILYCDSAQPEVPGPEADMIEVLVHFATKSIDLLSLAPKHAPAPAPAPRPAAPPAAAPPPAPRPAAPAPPPPHEEGSATLMFNATQFAPPRPPVATPPPRPVAPATPAPIAIPPEEQKSHDDAKRFARLVVSEIKLYNEARVTEGRRNRDLYERLKEDIERGRQMYNDRVTPKVREHANYFVDELIRILAGGDASALGPM